jgi:preprotein translocase subunit SecA
MVDAVLAKIFGTRNEREVKAMRPVIAAINDLEPSIQNLSDIDLAAKTIEFKEKIARGASLDD